MAKRSKNKKKGKLGYIILFIIIVIIAIVCIGINKNWFGNHKEHNNEPESLPQEIISKLQQNSTLNSNLLNPEELNNEIFSKLGNISQDEVYATRIHYKLKSLDNGTIDLYYEINNSKLLKININILEKKIESVEEYKDDALLEREKIVNNLSENVQDDFESKKDKLDSENKSVNVIITNTEIVINTSFDS